MIEKLLSNAAHYFHRCSGECLPVSDQKIADLASRLIAQERGLDPSGLTPFIEIDLMELDESVKGAVIELAPGRELHPALEALESGRYKELKELLLDKSKVLPEAVLFEVWNVLINENQFQLLGFLIKHAQMYGIDIPDTRLIHLIKFAKSESKHSIIRTVNKYVKTLQGRSYLKQVVKEILMNFKERTAFLADRVIEWNIDGLNNEKIKLDHALPVIIKVDLSVELSSLLDTFDELVVPDTYRYDLAEDKTKLISKDKCRENIRQLIGKIMTPYDFKDGVQFSLEDRVHLKLELQKICTGLRDLDDDDKARFLGSLGVGAGHCRDGIMSTVSAVKGLIASNLAGSHISVNFLEDVARWVQRAKTSIALSYIDYNDPENNHIRMYYLNVLGRDIDAEGAPSAVYVDSYKDRKIPFSVLTPTEAITSFKESYTDDFLSDFIAREVNRNMENITKAYAYFEGFIDAEEITAKKFFEDDENLVPQITLEGARFLLEKAKYLK